MKKKRATALLVLFALVAGLIANAGAKKVDAAEENIIINGNFEGGTDLSEWSAHQNDAVITCEKSDTPIVGNITTYGKITNRTSNYQCFAQEITGKVESGTLYRYAFYVMLDPEDYKDAPEAQRKVEISPHIRVDGVDNYSQFVGGTVSQTLEPGVWTKFEGTFAPTWVGNCEFLALRFLEQGTEYGQGAGVMGTYYITGVRLYIADTSATEVEKNIPDLCEAMQENLGDDDFLVGLAICGNDISDPNVMGLVYKHANCITLGNELKPDCMFGYSNNAVPGKHTIDYHGEPLDVPNLDYSRAERILNKIYDWNQNNPDHMIKVRGHVLVWHQQTPAWWFHEDYDVKKPFASIELMNRRLEWYIQTVCEHFTGPESKYRGMFYGWDVVNEAIDGTSYRKTESGSETGWWSVYHSNEYILNAFKFANMYMDPSVDLYYNDFGETAAPKVQGIVNLVNDVKAYEGARIDGIGMQAHYATGEDPTTINIKLAIKNYCKVVDKVMFTEFDLSTSGFDGSEASRINEYRKQALRYKKIYDIVRSCREEGCNFIGITWWGVIDKGSWLQNQSNVGGQSGRGKQLPLLFDDDYKAKLAFWAFADEEKFQTGYKAMNTPTPVPTATSAPTPTAEPTNTPVPTETPLVTVEPDNNVTQEPDVQKSNDNILLIVIIAAGVVLLGGGATVYILSSKRKKK